jgi:hypothetical protein
MNQIHGLTLAYFKDRKAQLDYKDQLVCREQMEQQDSLEQLELHLGAA